MAYTDTVRNNILDAVNAVAAFVAPTGPMKVRLMTANGTSATAGTELATGAGSGTGAGYTAGGQVVTLPAAAAGATAPTTVVRWDNLASCTITGVEIWDSAGTPKRWQFAPLVVGTTPTPKAVASGDSFEFAVGAFTETLV